MKTVQIELTPEQIEQLQPLFDHAAKHKQSGFVFGQAWDGDDVANQTRGISSRPMVVFGFCTPKDVIERVEKAILLRDTEMPL